jgi:YD repeat-containing protein
MKALGRRTGFFVAAIVTVFCFSMINSIASETSVFQDGLPHSPFMFEGGFHYGQTDIFIPSPGFPLTVTRTYNSNSSFPGVFGHGWHSEFDQRIVFNPGRQRCHVVEPGGTLLEFRLDAERNQYVSLRKGWQTVTVQENGTAVRTFPGGRTDYFDASGRLVKRSDLNGNEQRLIFSENGHLVQVVSSAKQSLFLSYDGNGRISRIEGSNGRVYRYEVNPDGDLVMAVDPLGRSTLYEYDNNHKLTGVRYPDGNGKSVSYDADTGLILSEAGPGEYRREYAYDFKKLAIKTTDGNNQKTVTSYSSDFKRKTTSVPTINQINLAICCSRSVRFRSHRIQPPVIMELVRRCLHSKSVELCREKLQF